MDRPSLVIVGNGMVGQRLVDLLVASGAPEHLRIVVVGEEPVPAYDRVNLVSVLAGRSGADLSLVPPELLEGGAVEYRIGSRVASIDTSARTITEEGGATTPYDDLVLATGAAAVVPPVPGGELAGCFTLRGIDDLLALRQRACTAPRGLGTVVGGGLLGIEAASALSAMGLQVQVVEAAPWLLPQQLSREEAEALAAELAELGLVARCGATVAAVIASPGAGEVGSVRLAGGEELASDLVVFSIGARPRHELALSAGLAVGPRGGVVIDDQCRASAPGVFAIGDVACHQGRVGGLVTPGYEMAEVVAEQLTGRRTARLAPGPPDPPPAALKLFAPPRVQVRPLGRWRDSDRGPLICACKGVSETEVLMAVDEGARTAEAVAAATGAGQGCGGCVPQVQRLLATEMQRRGQHESQGLCRHFDLTRQELFGLARQHGHRSFAEVLTCHGRGRGCEICRPVVASILASLWGGHILDGDLAAAQDTNDHALANLQRNGTYSVVPRVPGGEITPHQLVALGEIARDFDLYCKITGAQRVALFGARLGQLPSIWQRVIEAGMESGHAYGRAVRTVKSCVGEAWCRYGVQDSVGMAIRLELRYRGLRAPHKLKAGVSGCARECAEARSKDIGVIATGAGWNLYVCGNGGSNPRHGELLAEDLDGDALVRLIDRFVAYYVRTAGPLQRTSVWLDSLAGGLQHLREVLIEDSLGICRELEEAVEQHVAGYECEWKATLADPARLALFVEHLNDPEALVEPAWGRERGQRVPFRDTLRERLLL